MAPDFDMKKPVGRGARSSDFVDDDDVEPPTIPYPDNSRPASSGDGDDDGRPEELEKRSGGNVAPNFNINKPVGSKVSRSTLDLSVDDILGPPLPIPDPGPSTDETDDERRPEELEKRSGGNVAPDFDISKPVGRGARAVRGDEDPSTDDPIDDHTHEDPGPIDPSDGRPEELEKRNAGGNKAPDFDISKPVGRGVREDDDLVEDDVEPGTDDSRTDDPVDDRATDDDDGRPELEARSNAGGWKRVI